MQELILPVRITLSSLATGTSNLLVKKPLQIGLSETCTTVFEGGGYVILDFGKEMCGGIRLLTFRSCHTPVRIRFGESLSECCSDLGGKQNATNDHSLRDFTVLLQDYSDMSFGQTGFRFVRLDFEGAVRIKSIVACSQILKKKARYCYSGNDARISAIFEAAKRTIDLCVANGYVWDGIKRDRLVWIGDMSPEVLAITTLYGRLPQVERSLDFAKKQFPLPLWMNSMPAYSLWFRHRAAENRQEQQRQRHHLRLSRLYPDRKSPPDRRFHRGAGLQYGSARVRR